MPEYVENVNKAFEELRDWAEQIRAADRGGPYQRLDSIADLLAEVPDELVRLYGLTSALPADLGNVHDLPPELLEELSVAKADELEDQLVTVIRAYGDEASLDQILVGLWRKFKVSQKRRFLQNKLYRMDTIWSVPGRKGVYTTTEPHDQHEPKITSSEGDGYGSYVPPVNDLDSDIPF
ncbi:hypothetical protein FHS72_003722 [Loktanella ponticola]|uniref:Uncharacterized protein n=1 Tax=Yoonia ponticola TaxID=1524255 RepID=A0A7W9EZR2_9RHOB|nr:hypothetical protein [Yoonia ponticola]MBB5724072.1 hypothetical protein [Yoonia ponticola]